MMTAARQRSVMHGMLNAFASLQLTGLWVRRLGGVRQAAEHAERGGFEDAGVSREQVPATAAAYAAAPVTESAAACCLSCKYSGSCGVGCYESHRGAMQSPHLLQARWEAVRSPRSVALKFRRR